MGLGTFESLFSLRLWTGWGALQQADTGSGVVRLPPPPTACQESSTLSPGSCLHAIDCFDLC